MTVQAEVSLYPLGESSLSPAIEQFLDVLRQHGLQVHMGPMSSLVAGPSADVFAALAEAFSRVAAQHRCVLTVKVSNACPVEKKEDIQEAQ